MSTESVTPLRQGIVEDMNVSKLGAETHRVHILSYKRGQPRERGDGILQGRRTLPETISQHNRKICIRIVQERRSHQGFITMAFADRSVCRWMQWCPRRLWRETL